MDYLEQAYFSRATHGLVPWCERDFDEDFDPNKLGKEIKERLKRAKTKTETVSHPDNLKF